MKKWLLLTLITGVPLFGQIVVFDDPFTDGDRTGGSDPQDTEWYGSTGSSAIEIDPGSLGLRSGTSGRGIHGIFSPQTLSNVGDGLVARFEFTTPNTVAGGDGKDTGLRVGMFNSNGITINEDSPSHTDPKWRDISGYMANWDVNVSGADIDHRKRLPDDPSDTSDSFERLLSTTSVYDRLGGGGDDYSFTANTNYTGVYSITMTDTDELTLAAQLLDENDVVLSEFSLIDTSDLETTYDFLAFHANSNTFGSTADAGDPDNGLSFDNVSLQMVPEPSTYAMALGLLSLIWVGIMRRRKAR